MKKCWVVSCSQQTGVCSGRKREFWTLSLSWPLSPSLLSLIAFIGCALICPNFGKSQYFHLFPQITSDNPLFKQKVHLFLSSTLMILCTSWFSIPPPLTHDVVLYHFSLLPICNIISHWVRSLRRGPTVKVLCVQHTFPMTVHMFLIRLREQAHNKQ